MAEYIEREAVLADELTHCLPYSAGKAAGRVVVFAEDIEAIPAADVAPVVHGRWEPIIEGVWNLPTPVLVGWRCSACGRTEPEKEPYCNCGAKMMEVH